MKKCVLGTCNCTVQLFSAALILGGALPASAQIDKNMCCLADGGCEDLSVETCENGKGISYAGRSCDPDLDISRCSGSGSSCKRNIDCPAGQTCEPDGNGQCPDCNCDGATDSKEIGDCTAQCVDGGGNQEDCRDACSIECGGNLVPKKCDLKGCRDDSGCVAANACDQCRAETGKCGPRDCGDSNKCSIDFCEETDASVCQDEDGNGSQQQCTSTAECDTVGEKCVFQGWQCVHEPDHSICDDNNACTDDICNVNTGGSLSFDSCC